MLCLVTQSSLTLCDPMDCGPPDFSVHGDSPGKNTGVGCHALLQGIFPTQELIPGLIHCSQILYCMSHRGSLWILEWVAYPFSRGSSWPRNETQYLLHYKQIISWATKEALRSKCLLISWLQSPSAVIWEPPKISISLFPLFPHLFARKWGDWMPWS